MDMVFNTTKDIVVSITNNNTYHGFAQEDRRMLKQVLETVIDNNQKLKKMSTELDALTTEVSETKTVMGSAVVLLQGLKAKLDEAGTDKVKLAALSAELDTNTNALAEAITANTPAEEPPV